MAEHPILFSTEMVRAILDDRKTKSRRITGLKVINNKPDEWRSLGANWMRRFLFEIPNDNVDKEKRFACSCPYGEVGDRLWVRENLLLKREKGTPYFDALYADGVHFESDINAHNDNDEWFMSYRNWYDSGKSTQIIPSIHMPRWATRIFLEITNIRVERMQDISESDAEAEGTNCDRTYREDFKNLWDSLNAKRGFGWDKNPWVWVVEFKRLPKGE